jgi:hypothetical protein
MANASYIIGKSSAEGLKDSKTGFRSFYGPLDKGSAKPSFCYPAQKEALREEIRSMEKAVSDGFVAETRILKVKADLKMKKDRLDKINAQESDAMKLYKENKDACMKRREEIQAMISDAMPTEKDVQRRRVNPHRVLEMEKKKGLGKLKLEYQVLSHLAEEESNTKFLQKEA